ncbi:MAG: YbbR-like domain-containing protein, partial [Bacteriovoracaceae bacterium]|nr:YbbR-like domain-containing protein [Bacteriovoracaceae bacterium]
PAGYAVKNQPVNEITYAIKGPRVFVRSIMSDEDKLVVDLQKFFKKNKSRYEINVNDLGMSFPFGVEVTRVEPNRLVVRLEKSLIKEVPVRKVLVGEVPSDHKMISSSIEPKKIMIEGPISVARKIKYIETAPIELNGLTGSSSMKAGVIVPDERIKLESEFVEFKYTIHPTRANMILKNIPVKFLSSQLIKGSDRRTVNLMVLADNKDKLNYSPKDIKVIADVPDKSRGKVIVELRAQLPQGLHLLEIQPKTIAIEVEGK